MQANILEVDISSSRELPLSKIPPRISPRTFAHCLNALFVHTKVLSGNVVSLHLHLAGQTVQQENIPLFLSHLQLELVGQAGAIERYSNAHSTTPLLPQEWVCYGDLWRITDINDTPHALSQLREGTDVLTGLYEMILPVAAAQPDQATSFFMLAEHLVALNAYCLAMERFVNKDGIVLLPFPFNNN